MNDGILWQALFHSGYRVWLRSVIPSFNELCRCTLRLIYIFWEKQSADCCAVEGVSLWDTNHTKTTQCVAQVDTQAINWTASKCWSAEMWGTKSRDTCLNGSNKRKKCSLRTANRVRMRDEFHGQKILSFFTNCFFVCSAVNSILQIRKVHSRSSRESPEGE